MTGSGCLASMSALRTGAGLVYAGVPKSLAPVYAAKMTEPIIIPLEDNGEGCLSASCAGHILELAENMDVVAIGPGLTASEDIRKIVEAVIENCRVPLVIDADALNAISADPSVLKKLKTEAVLTPHPGEMARLAGTNTKQVQSDRIGTSSEFAQKYGTVVVLKGSKTVVAYPDGRVLINTTGNAGMATAGAGDVLTGIIAGIIARGAGRQRFGHGVCLHGIAGDARLNNGHARACGRRYRGHIARCDKGNLEGMDRTTERQKKQKDRKEEMTEGLKRLNRLKRHSKIDRLTD